MNSENKHQTNVKVEVETKNEKDELEIPKDKFYITFILFFFLGLVHYLPWSFFTCATEFWMYKFRNTTINDTDSEFRTDLQAQFTATLNITLQISEVAFLIIGLLFGRHITVKTRIIGILCNILCLFTIITIFVKIDTDSWQVGFFVLVMAITAGINASNAVFTITIYTVLSNFPHSYLAPYLAGGGLSRVFTSILQILSLAVGLSVQNSALVYFSLGVLVIAFTLLSFLLTMNTNKFYLHHMRNFQDGQKEKRVGFKEGVRLVKKIWSPIVLMGVYLLASDASPVALVVSEGEGEGPWSDLYFIPTITYLVASACDLLGRNIGFKYSLKLNNFGWVFVTAVRTAVFIPLFMLCNAQPRHHLPVIFPHDYQYIIFQVLFSISGGYLLSRYNYNIAGLVTPEELKDAYHVSMLFTGLEMGVLCFVGIVSVDLL